MDTLMYRTAAFVLLLSIGSKMVAATDRTEYTNKLAETFERAQTFNKQYVYREHLQPVTSDTTEEVLEKLVGQVYKELCCSYAFSVVLHLRYTRAYLNKPENLKMMTIKQVENILFTEESAAVLAVMHDHDEWNQWSGIVDIMWIFRVYTDKVAEFIRRYRDDDEAVSKSPVLRSHRAVEMLFTRFVNANRCAAHDPDTYEPADIGDVYKTGVVEPFGLANAVLAENNKSKFRLQISHNKRKGLTVGRRHRFTEVGLRLNDFLVDDDRADADALQTAFETHPDWRPLVECLRVSYRKSAEPYVRLAQHIDDLAAFHDDFLTTLKIVFVRIVAKHVKLMVNACSAYDRSTFHCGRYNAKMLERLREFARYTGLSEDRHLVDVVDLLNKRYWRFGETDEINEYLMRVQEFQKEATASGRCCYGKVQAESTPIVIDDKRSRTAEVAKDFEQDTSDHYTILHPIRENLLGAEVFVEFVQKVTNKIDFGVIGSFGSVNKSLAFKQFTVLELCLTV